MLHNQARGLVLALIDFQKESSASGRVPTREDGGFQVADGAGSDLA